MIWTPENVRRIILDTAGGLMGQLHAGLGTDVSATFDLHRDLGLDSLQRMALAAHLNEFFGILHTSADNYLLAQTTLGHWERCILRARAEDDTWLTFRTSGTSGASQPKRHRLTTLLAEARFLADLLGQPTNLVSTVAAGHIYGFLYTVLLPHLWQCPLRLLGNVAVADLTPQSLVVGTPFTWEFLARSWGGTGALRCRGVSSTAPLPPALFGQLQQAGVGLTEVYGSSDTGGLAYRTAPDAPFTLFPYWHLRPTENAAFLAHRSDTNEDVAIPDRLERIGERQLRVLGRLDESVSIAGVNVYPAHVRRVIEQCPLVADADIYAKADATGPQLYGAIRLRSLTDATRTACLRWLDTHLTAPERPKHLYLY